MKRVLSQGQLPCALDPAGRLLQVQRADRKRTFARNGPESEVSRLIRPPVGLNGQSRLCAVWSSASQCWDSVPDSFRPVERKGCTTTDHVLGIATHSVPFGRKNEMRFLENCDTIAEVVDDIDAKCQIILWVTQSCAFGRCVDPMKSERDSRLRLGQHSRRRVHTPAEQPVLSERARI